MASDLFLGGDYSLRAAAFYLDLSDADVEALTRDLGLDPEHLSFAHIDAIAARSAAKKGPDEPAS